MCLCTLPCSFCFIVTKQQQVISSLQTGYEIGQLQTLYVVQCNLVLYIMLQILSVCNHLRASSRFCHNKRLRLNTQTGKTTTTPPCWCCPSVWPASTDGHFCQSGPCPLPAWIHIWDYNLFTKGGSKMPYSFNLVSDLCSSGIYRGLVRLLLLLLLGNHLIWDPWQRKLGYYAVQSSLRMESL